MLAISFSLGYWQLFCCSQCQLPTSNSSISSVQSLLDICLIYGCVEGFFFILRMFSACLWLSTLTSKFPFWWVALNMITFSVKKGENLACQTASKVLMTMNLGNYAASFSKSDFFIRRHHKWCLFFTGPMLHHPPWSSTCDRNVPRRKHIHLGWDRDMRPVYISWE